MEKNINQLVKPIQSNGQLLTHKDDPKNGVTQYYCSCYIEREKLLVKGECRNPRQSQRNALIIFLDLETGLVRGESLHFCL